MDVGLGRAGLEAQERVGEVVAGPVELGREIIALGLALAAQLGGLLLVLVHVVGDRPEVVEELAVDRPALVGVPQAAADHLGAEELDRLFEGEPVAVVDDVAESLVGRCPFVGRGGRRGEPALVDPAAVGAQGIEVLARQLEPAARHQERPRHPGRGQPQDPFTGLRAPRAPARRDSARSSPSLSDSVFSMPDGPRSANQPANARSGTIAAIPPRRPCRTVTL